MKPPFAYYGGKAGMAEKLIALMPPHRVYMEPFFGSGSVLFAKPPVRHEIINDLDDAVVAFFKVLRERPGALEMVCALTPHSRTEFANADLDEDVDELERARRFWVRVNQSFAKNAGPHTGWSITTSRTQSVAATCLSRVGRFAACADRLSRVAIENCDAGALVRRLATDETVVYLDPSYVHSSRRSSHGRLEQKDYRHEMTDDDHRELAEVLHETEAFVLLSGYRCDLYEDLYGGWPSIDFEVSVHSSKAMGTERTGRVETIWTNRPVAARAATLDFGGAA